MIKPLDVFIKELANRVHSLAHLENRIGSMIKADAYEQIAKVINDYFIERERYIEQLKQERGLTWCRETVIMKTADGGYIFMG
jgi:hypothetical protein